MKNWLRLLLLPGFYGLLFVVFTWPLAGHFGTSFLTVAGPGHDTYGFIWNAWHFREAVQQGHSPYYTNWMFYPHGSGLLLHAYTPILGLLNLLLGHELLAVNTALLLSCALSGAGAYLLARRWVRSPVLCLLAGFVFAYSPYKLQRLPEHYNLMLTATVPFYVLVFLRAFQFREGWRLPVVRSWAAVAGCFGLGFITLLSDYYVLFGLLYFSLAYALWFWLRLGSIRWREKRTWLWLAGLLLGCHLLGRGLSLLGVPADGLWWAGDLVAFLMPPPTSRFEHWQWAARLYHNGRVFNAPGSHENTLFIGYLLPLLALGLLLLRLAGRRGPSRLARSGRGRPLAWVLVFFLLMAVPTLRIYGHDRLYLPTALPNFIPFINHIRCPTRWIMMVGLLLPLVTFSALEAAWRGRLRPVAQVGLSLLLALGVLIEFWPRPYARASLASVPAVFRQVARLPGTTLIAVPLGILDGTRQIGQMRPEDMFYQTVHHKKLPGGSLSVVGPEQYAAFEREPVLRTLLALQTRPDSAVIFPTQTQVAAFLRGYQPAAFVVSPAFREQPVHSGLRRMLIPFGYREQLVAGYALLVVAPGRGAEKSPHRFLVKHSTF